jgi:phosphoglycerate dehydrogenase-like enzyme
MINNRSVAVFAFDHPWMQEMVLKVAPPEFEVKFLDVNDPGQVEILLPQADFIMINQLPAEWVALLKRCKLVHHQGVGYDGIDVAALKRAGIPLATTPEGTIIGVAEHTILLILALSKQLVQVHESMRQGKFLNIDWRINAHFLYRKTLGIVGFGRIGRRVAQLARGFEAQLIYYDPVRPPEAVEQELGVSYVPFEALLPQADIISVHTPLTPETKGLFGSAQFSRMKPGTFFINTSRGGTYDMDALYEYLWNGHLGGAGLDVFNPEPPPPDHPILQLPNVICTPHVATGTVEAHLQKAEAQFENFKRVLRGEPPNNQVVVAD